MAANKESLLNDIRGAATIPMDSEVRPITDLAESGSGSLVEQLSSLSERILDEVKETNRLVYELFTTDANQIKEDSSEKQAIRKDPHDASAKLLAGLISELSFLFQDLKDSLSNMKISSGGGDSDIDFPGGKKILKRLWKGIKSIGKLGARLAPGASAVTAAGMGTKDLYDVFSGKNGGANAENMGGAIGSVAGAGIGVLLAGLIGVGTGGAGLAAGTAIVSGSSAIGNMLGEYIGGLIDTEAPKSNDQKQYGLPSDNDFTNRFKDLGKQYESAKASSPKSEKSSSSKPKKVSAPSVTSGSTSSSKKAETKASVSPSPTTASTKDGGLASVNPSNTEVSAPTPLKMDALAVGETNSKLSVVAGDSLAEDSIEIKSPIVVGEDGSVSSQPIPGGPSKSISTLALGDVPNPNYTGSAISIFSEMYV